jgi:hypothetical protein
LTIFRSTHSPNRSSTVRDAYHEYLEWAKSLLTLAEKLSSEEWPDRTRELQNVFGLQILYNQRESLRFEYLLESTAPDIVASKSLSRINERLLKDWSESEEAGLKESNSTYRDVLQGIADLEGKTDSPALDQPFQALTRNANYRVARQTFAQKIEQLNERLSL